MKTDTASKKRTFQGMIQEWTFFIGVCVLLVVFIPVDFVNNLLLAPKIWWSIRDLCKKEFGYEWKSIWIATLPLLIVVCPFGGIAKDWFETMKICKFVK